MNDFKLWLENTSKFDQLVQEIAKIFGPNWEPEITSTPISTIISFSDKIRQVNLVYFTRPVRMQIGFFFKDINMRKTFGSESQKDQMTNQQIMQDNRLNA